jgi:hypothetical protein
VKFHTVEMGKRVSNGGTTDTTDAPQSDQRDRTAGP